MTFEEFFTKKKIDLKALKAADEPLFEEFRAHYSAMGEKSFDHSKKFWFNRLRKSYHLAEEEAVVIKKPIQTGPAETAPATTDISAAKPAGFKPRFKAAVPAEPAEQKEEPTTEPSTAAANSTAGFKPRFKPGITKNTATTTEETSAPTDLSNDNAPETTKPTGFKPRFKPGVTKAADSTIKEDTSSQTEASGSPITEPSKPAGFKPRFKSGVTKAVDSTVNENISSPAEASGSPATEAPKPTGFKPRFKAGLTKAAEPLQPTSSTFDEADPANPSIEPQQENIAETDTTAVNKPAGFKPRFKAGVTKTASTDDKQAIEPAPSANSSVADPIAPSAVTNSAVTANTSTPAEASGSPATEAPKSTGFKPRFKAGVTKTASTDSSSTAVPSVANTDATQEVDPPTENPNAKKTVAPEATATGSSTANPTGEPQQNDDTTPEQTAASKPTGFKPRFKAGLTKIDKKEE